MSAPKQLAKRQKLERKRRRKHEALRRRQRRRQADLRPSELFDVFPAVSSPVGGIKMSTVLEDFLAPWADSAENIEAYSTIISMGVVAWNAALEPAHWRAAFVSSAIDAAMKNASIQERLACREFIENLIVRKLEYFAEYHRPILAFQLDELDDGGWYLSVASGLC
jgi:hypothetical protein